MSQNYVKYTNSAFPNLTFDVLKKWEVVQNDLEIVFWIPNVGLPQLFLQTVGKFEDKQDIDSFYNFVIKNLGASSRGMSESLKFIITKQASRH